jgi:capsular polysaccharide transport system ATP-binding protein
MIELRNVTKVYPTQHGAHVVLRDITADIPAKTNYGVMGRNGAGKSTLLRVLSGTEYPDAGTVTRKGRISWPIGFAGGFSTALNAEENAKFVARVYGADGLM